MVHLFNFKFHSKLQNFIFFSLIVIKTNVWTYYVDYENNIKLTLKGLRFCKLLVIGSDQI